MNLMNLARTTPVSSRPNTGTGWFSLAPYEERNGREINQYQMINAQPEVSDFSLDELRLADYQLGRGGDRANRVAQLAKSTHETLFRKPILRVKRARGQGHLSMLRGPSIEVCVGPASCSCADKTTCECQVSWTLPTALLSHHSPFLKAACSRNFKEREENRIALPKDDPPVFARFVEWMYYGTYDASQSEAVNIDISSWILGDKLLSTQFKNYAMRHLYEAYMSALFPKPITTRDAQYLLENTSVESKLRLFFLALLVERFSDPMRLQGTTEEWDEVLLDHSDARSFLLSGFRMAPGERKFVKSMNDYMSQDEPLLQGFGRMNIGGGAT
ncbi:hypothetical protein BDW02DRAFT_584222 [Decorospora gaudefroyi]|uniref:BTB domain-containing protein n=1 Tax=Decorospora gaudefroyi TaxID=184978 RepID=A0A6A5K3G5_9PLEO|nr:hypothetical protein BDW02DRAFT_584222 [Decorospora gaudefroyi]